MTTTQDSKDLEAQMEGLHQIYCHLLDLISPGISQLLGDGFPTVRFARTAEVNKPTRKGNAKVRLLCLLISISLVDFMFLEAAEYGDSSATYWMLYMSEAEISDQKLVETLTTDTTAISILVSCDTRWA